MTRPLGVTAAKAEAVAATNCTFFLKVFWELWMVGIKEKPFFKKEGPKMSYSKWMIDVPYCDEDIRYKQSDVSTFKRKNHQKKAITFFVKQPNANSTHPKQQNTDSTHPRYLFELLFHIVPSTITLITPGNNTSIGPSCCEGPVAGGDVHHLP